MQRLLKIGGGLMVLYVLVVAGFESMLGYFQPEQGNTLRITTFDSEGTPHTRVVSRLDHEGHLHIAANHWPRVWYGHVLANPRIDVETKGVRQSFNAIPVSPEEQAALQAAHPHSLRFRLLTGFPPRRFVRLEPVSQATEAPASPADARDA
ncbi:MAG: nitroreductase/quinone reductase family protein [Pseudomonadales bacterium]